MTARRDGEDEEDVEDGEDGENAEDREDREGLTFQIERHQLPGRRGRHAEMSRATSDKSLPN